jgi:hypothetical protein
LSISTTIPNHRGDLPEGTRRPYSSWQEPDEFLSA